MVKQLIGGVALAATGYGVKRYFEDCCVINGLINDTLDKNSNEEDKGHSFFVDLSNYKDVLPELKEAIDKYVDVKVKLFNGSLRELRTALLEIKNLDKELVITNIELVEKYDFKFFHNETLKNIEKFTQILQKTKHYIDKHLDSLDTIIISSNDFTTYSEEDKKFVENFAYLCTTIDKIDNSKMTYDKMTISREVKRGFGKVETIID
ncbi:MAG: hypothetical protein PHQ93_00060 [Sulfurimonas sp.]|uniref:hypothetical protein n=1 Tax=Sulfurimonas sp. TaxID=2022749 RepID=UPI00261CF13A|nr:hypothetical protein [Sulfurimonas sp.]MDD5399568.1 hypothetical protein [Sulfurimonas sp.]